MEKPSPDIRAIVAIGCRVLANEGHGDFVWGHVSARDPDRRGLWIRAAGPALGEIDEDRVVLIDWDGAVLDGAGRPPVEFPIHSELMRADREIGAVVHTHPPHAIALGISEHDLLPISRDASLFVPPGVPRYSDTADLIATRSLGESVASVMDEARAVLMVNHGIATAGADVVEAVVRAVILERTCRQQLLAQSAGGKLRLVSPAETVAMQRSWSRSNIVAVWECAVREMSGRCARRA